MTYIQEVMQLQNIRVKSNKNSFLLLKALISGIITGLITCTVFLVLFASVFVKLGSISQNFVQILSLVAASVGAFVSGYVALRVYKEKGLYIGAICGSFVFLIFIVSGFFVSWGDLSSFTFVKLTLLTFFGALGGVLGTNKKSRRVLK